MKRISAGACIRGNTVSNQVSISNSWLITALRRLTTAQVAAAVWFNEEQLEMHSQLDLRH